MSLTLQHDMLDVFLELEALQQCTELEFVSQRGVQTLNVQVV